eukprot:CAMPEP_0202704484 /NCGR_PEP_ID=MMETSP1385-20130828/17159_1 /ASSEMBLY_ACC=CAM_ASM_000861 /TAXON_ID=933848 /ORGANISM="Elphidium margaritaceum" /LENGTH=281 /DNA_ID=CAMNT_0049362523 /DNA_START=50 /DNA_END=895 /DNA_ORIENTATION=+
MAAPKKSTNDKTGQKKKKDEKEEQHNNSNTHEHDHNHQHHDHTHGQACSHGHDHTHAHSHACNHGHGGGGGGCQHDHESNDPMSFGTSLYQFIDRKNIKCLNESVSAAGKGVFKAFDDRFDATVFVESDVDGELLFTVYFTAEVQLRSIQLTMHDQDSAPTLLQLWNDKADKIDFDNHTEHKCQQSIELAFDNQCEIHWKTSQHKFNDLTVLKMLFKKEDYDEDDNDTEIRLNYIGLKGDYKGPKSRRAVHTIYEAAANPNDHATVTSAQQKNEAKNNFIG